MHPDYEMCKALSCGHAFHHECLMNLSNVRGVTFEDLKCPHCGRSSRYVALVADDGDNDGRATLEGGDSLVRSPFVDTLMEDEIMHEPVGDGRDPAVAGSGSSGSGTVAEVAALAAGTPAADDATGESGAPTANAKAKVSTKSRAKPKCAADKAATDTADGGSAETAKSNAKAKAGAVPKSRAKAKAKAKATAMAAAVDDATDAAGAAAAPPNGTAGAAASGAGGDAADDAASVGGNATPRASDSAAVDDDGAPLVAAAKATGKAKSKAKAKAKAQAKAKAAGPESSPPEVAAISSASDAVAANPFGELDVEEQLGDDDLGKALQVSLNAGFQGASLAFGHVSCSTCGEPCSFEKCRLLSKDVWRCNVCGVRVTQLRRALGKWPTDSFCQLAKAPRDPVLAKLP
jgi:hypothetical protein